MELVFLQLDEVLAIHRDQIERYGGTLGVRDTGLLDSAIAMPTASFEGCYLHDDLFDMAAAYLYHIVRNHPFLDGNKRTGVVAALVFLALNNVRANVEDEPLERLVTRVAEGTGTKKEVAAFLREHAGRAS